MKIYNLRSMRVGETGYFLSNGRPFVVKARYPEDRASGVTDIIFTDDGRHQTFVWDYHKSSDLEVVMSKELLVGLFRDNPETPEGKYLVKRRDGSVAEWPSFVLGARDPYAAIALRAYADALYQGLKNGDQGITPEFIVGVRRWADKFDQYRKENGEGDPGKGRHRRDDPATIEEMKKGMSA